MHHYRAERIIKTKYREMKVVNYRQENDDSNILSTCTFLDCDEYRIDYDGQTDTTRQKRTLGIRYKHESKEDIAKYCKTMQAMLAAFLQMNTKNTGIQSVQADQIGRTYPPLFTLNLPKEEEIIDDVREITAMEYVVQVIMIIVCVALT